MDAQKGGKKSLTGKKEGKGRGSAVAVPCGKKSQIGKKTPQKPQRQKVGPEGTEILKEKKTGKRSSLPSYGKL